MAIANKDNLRAIFIERAIKKKSQRITKIKQRRLREKSKNKDNKLSIRMWVKVKINIKVTFCDNQWPLRSYLINEKFAYL